MKISSYLTSNISDAYLKQSRATRPKDKGDVVGTSESRKPKKDEIVLSPRAIEVRKFEGVMESIPEMRPEKIEVIKGQIESGAYTVDGRMVARSIINLLS